jgi:hypothetical protein
MTVIADEESKRDETADPRANIHSSLMALDKIQ